MPRKCPHCGAPMFTKTMCASSICPGPEDEPEFDDLTRSEFDHDREKDEGN